MLLHGERVLPIVRPQQAQDVVATVRELNAGLAGAFLVGLHPQAAHFALAHPAGLVLLPLEQPELHLHGNGLRRQVSGLHLDLERLFHQEDVAHRRQRRPDRHRRNVDPLLCSDGLLFQPRPQRHRLLLIEAPRRHRELERAVRPSLILLPRLLVPAEAHLAPGERLTIVVLRDRLPLDLLSAQVGPLRQLQVEPNALQLVLQHGELSGDGERRTLVAAPAKGGDRSRRRGAGGHGRLCVGPRPGGRGYTGRRGVLDILDGDCVLSRHRVGREIQLIGERAEGAQLHLSLVDHNAGRAGDSQVERLALCEHVLAGLRLAEDPPQPHCVTGPVRRAIRVEQPARLEPGHDLQLAQVAGRRGVVRTGICQHPQVIDVP